MLSAQQDIIRIIKKSAMVINDTQGDFNPLIDVIRNKSFILLGEATHGTQEFYETRVAITKQLIIDHGLNAIAIEGDWPAAYRVNRYVRWQGSDANANEALSSFTRFPMWMWRNTVILEFVEWLREYNEGLASDRQVGFYGLDMYSMYESIEAVLKYLDQVDPEAAASARKSYGCLDHANNERLYGFGVTLRNYPSCEEDVVRQLTELRERAVVYVKEGDEKSEEDQFHAEQNARLIQSAEEYYRQMFNSRVNTWNLRDTHMLETLDNLYEFLSRRVNRSARIAVWEHNSHLGDARATYMQNRGQHNVGQLVRENYGENCISIGFTTYSGTVTAASDWDAPAECKKINKAIRNSVEDIFYRTNLHNFFLLLQGDVTQIFLEYRLERAIGVVYLPETERTSHYFYCRLADQFDAVIHFDETRALEPLDPTSEWSTGEEATYPFGV